MACKLQFILRILCCAQGGAFESFSGFRDLSHCSFPAHCPALYFHHFMRFLACSQHTWGRNNTSITHHYTSVAYSSVAIPTVWSSCSNIISVHDSMVSHSICSSFIWLSKRERSEIAVRTSRPGPGQEDCLKPVGTSKSSSFI